MSILANILNIRCNTHLLDKYCFYCVIYGTSHFDEVSQYSKDGKTEVEQVIETFKDDCCVLSDDVDDDLDNNMDDRLRVRNFRSQKESKTKTKKRTEKRQWRMIMEENYYNVYSQQTITMSVIISTSSLNS